MYAIKMAQAILKTLNDIYNDVHSLNSNLNLSTYQLVLRRTIIINTMQTKND